MHDPVLSIGGVGGSGTRIVAEFAQACGIFIGGDLNKAKDNHHFGLVLKRPDWLRRNWRNDAAIDARIRTFQKYTSTHEPLSFEEKKLLASGLWEIGKIYHGIADTVPNPKYVAKRVAAMQWRWRDIPVNLDEWGWKEPNTHMILHRLDALFPKMKYIHVIRHGFDMAFSGNQQQVDNWSSLFDLPPSDGSDPLKSYRYWLAANRRAAEIGRAMGPDRFMIIQFEELCNAPEKIVDEFLSFTGKSVETRTRDHLVSLPRTPASVGRYRQHDLSLFDKEDIAALAEFGYSVT